MCSRACFLFLLPLPLATSLASHERVVRVTSAAPQEIMKQARNKNSSGKKSTGTLTSSTTASKADTNKPSSPDAIDDDNLGFGGWLKSDDGLETMKLFALANSIVLLTTVAYPHIQTVWDIIYDIFYGPDSF